MSSSEPARGAEFTERPLLTAAEAARLVWPALPERVGARRVYRWAACRVIPETSILRAGRALYIRRASFIAWLDGRKVNGA